MALRWARYQEGMTAVVWEGDCFSLDPAAAINRELALGLAGRGIPLAVISRGRRELDPAGDPRLAVLGDLERRSPASLPAPVIHVFAGQTPRFGPADQLSVHLALDGEAGSRDGGGPPGGAVPAGVPTWSVHDLPLGVAGELFRPGQGRPPRLPGDLRLLYVPGEDPDGEWEALVQAASRLAEPVTLVVLDPEGRAGLNPTGPLPVAHLTEPLLPEELAGLYGACHGLVYLGRRKGLGRLLEAMACGLPVTAGPGLDDPELRREGVLHVVTGAEPAAAGELTAALGAVVRGDPAVRARAAAAQAYVRTQRTWERAVDGLVRRLDALGREMPSGPLRRWTMRTVRERCGGKAGWPGRTGQGGRQATRGGAEGDAAARWILRLAPGQALDPVDRDAWFRLTLNAPVPAVMLDVAPADEAYGLHLIHPAARLGPAGIRTAPDATDAVERARFWPLTALLPAASWLDPEPPQNYHGLHRRAVGLAAAGRYAEAVPAFRAAWSRAPEAYRPLVLRNLAWSLWKAGQTEATFGILRDGESIYPGYTDLGYVRAVVYARLGDYESAAERLRACLDRGDAAPWHYAQPGLGSYRAATALGQCQARLGRWGPAVKSFLLALHYHSTYEPAIRALAAVPLDEAGLDIDAVTRLLESLADRSEPRCLVALAETYAAWGVASGVRRMVEQGLRAIRRGPHRRRLEALAAQWGTAAADAQQEPDSR